MHPYAKSLIAAAETAEEEESSSIRMTPALAKTIAEAIDILDTAASQAEERVKEAVEKERQRVKDLGIRLGGIRTERMDGDNLAILLCGYFDNPDQENDDETGWTPDAVSGCDEVLAAIRKHYEAIP